MAHTTDIDEITSHRKTRQTGATVTVTRVGPGSTYEQDSGWMTMCLDHGQLVFHDSRSLANDHAVTPADWCSDCASIHDGKRPYIAGPKLI